MPPNFRVNMLAQGETVEFIMYDRIGGSFFFDGISAKMVSQTLKNAPNCKLIKIRMSSPGGSVWEGNTIRSILAEHKARVEVDIDGLCASAATIVTMAADEIRIAENGMMMIHEAQGDTFGGVKQHRSAIEMLERVNDGAANVYARRTGKTSAEMLEMMAAETWFSADEAVAIKLADKVTAAKQVTASWKGDELSKVFHYQHVPERVLAWASDSGSGKTLEEDQPTEETATMTVNLNRIALALGLSDGADEAGVLSTIASLKDGRNALLGFMTEVEAMTGKRGAEAIGAMRAFKTSAERLGVLEQQVADSEKKLETQELAALIKQGKDDQKLTPAMVTYYEKRPVGELRGFLPIAPRVLGNGGQQQQPSNEGGGSGHPLAGKKWEELKPMEKHRLYGEDLASYQSVKHEYEQRTGRTVGG
jgi:ATP-dependent Clp protease protease subunit